LIKKRQAAQHLALLSFTLAKLPPSGQDVVRNTPLGGIPLLRRQLGALPREQLLTLNTALAELLQLMEVTENE
jgi:hypothetical protein